MVQRKYGVGFVLALYPLYVEVCVFQPFLAFNPLKWDFFKKVDSCEYISKMKKQTYNPLRYFS